MNMEQAFLQAIAQTGDDVDRLAYADWLQDTENPTNLQRAELIRLRVSLKNMPANAPQRAASEAREKELLAQEQQRFHADISFDQAAYDQAPNGYIEFNRQPGALEFVSMLVLAGGRQPPASLETGTSLEALNNTLTTTGLSNEVRFRSHDMRALAAIKFPDYVNSLDLTGCNLGGARYVSERDIEGMREFAQCENLGNITALNLSRTNIGLFNKGGEAIEVLGEAKSLTNLTRLNLSGNKIGGYGRYHTNGSFETLGALSRGRIFNNLTSLDLSNTSLGFSTRWNPEYPSQTIAILRQCENLRNLKELKLAGNDLHADAFKEFRRCRNLSDLKSLDLSHNHLGQQFLAILANCRQFTSLSQLDLRHNPLVTAEDVAPLCQAIRNGVFPLIDHVQIVDPAMPNQPAQAAQNAVQKAIDSLRHMPDTHTASALRRIRTNAERIR